MKNNILFILHIPPPIHGASVIGEQIKGSKLVNETFDCRFINLSTSKKINEIGKNPIVKIVPYLNILYLTVIHLINFKPDLCYITLTAKGTAFFKDAVIVLIVKLFKVNLIYHFHNKGIILKQDKFFYNIFYKTVFNNSKVILLSRYLYYDIKKYVDEKRVYYCPNGILDVISSKINSTVEKRITTLLFLSNLIESKGVYVLLEACKILKEKNIKFICLVAGQEADISVEKLLERISVLGLNDEINYLGPLYRKEKADILLKTDVFIFPTFYECFPLVLLEAMQNKIPVISTFEGGIPDIVIDGETGFLCKQKDAVCIADKIETLIKDYNLRKGMSEAGRKRYEENFTFEIFEKRFVEILSKVVNENK